MPEIYMDSSCLHASLDGTNSTIDLLGTWFRFIYICLCIHVFIKIFVSLEFLLGGGIAPLSFFVKTYFCARV